MQRLVNTLNALTSPIGNHIAFESDNTYGFLEKWNDAQSLNIIFGGKLKVILC